MKITLVQNEIEEAIKQYLGGQMTIAKGMAITIELKATRGDEGYMAFVDIRKDANWVAPVLVKSVPEFDGVAADTPKAEVPPTTPKPTLASRVTTRAAAPEPVVEEAEVIEPAEEEVVETEEAEEATAGPEVEQEDEALPEVAPVVQAAVVEKAAEGKPVRAGGRSLFGGLKKPAN